MNPSDHWNHRYADGNTPWDSGLVSSELIRVVDESGIAPSRALELGCGTGTNAVWLAQRGFAVTAVDCSELAIEATRHKAEAAGVQLEMFCQDVCELDLPGPPFPFVFDRGCYHCARRDNCEGILQVLERVTGPGSKFLVLTGNANEARDHGPPGLYEDDIRRELGDLFDIEFIRDFHFEDPGGVQGPLGWSSLLTRVLSPRKRIRSTS